MTEDLIGDQEKSRSEWDSKLGEIFILIEFAWLLPSEKTTQISF